MWPFKKKHHKVTSSFFLPEHERAVGRMIADSKGQSYVALQSLDEAKSFEDGVVILQGDDGGQIYLVSKASSVQCNEDELKNLLFDLDEMMWKDPDMMGIYYERLQEGSGVPGGMGGGRVESKPWIHDDLDRLGLRNVILDVLAGKRERIR